MSFNAKNSLPSYYLIMKSKKQINDHLIPLSDHLFLVPGANKGRYPFCNGFLLVDEETLLIDAGMGEKTLKALDDIFHIDHLLISHSHPDHFLCWHILQNRHILLPAETPDSVTDISALGIRFTGNKENSDYWYEKIWEKRGLTALRDPDKRYHHGEILDLGHVKLEAMHTPGHLDDHYCFFEHTSGTLLSIDIDFDGFGPWYGNPESSPVLFEKKAVEISHLPYSQVCCSHRPPMDKESASAAFKIYIHKFEEHRQTIFDLCKHPISQELLTETSPFYQDRLPDKRMQSIFERIFIQKILETLIAEGRVITEDGLYRQRRT